MGPKAAYSFPLDFPPLHTVRAPFSAHGAPSNRLTFFLQISIPLHPHGIQRTYKFHGFNFSRYFIILRTTFTSVSGGIGLLCTMR